MWYSKAAEQGNPGAESELGLLYENGQGVPQNYATAAQWLRKAADQGIAEAQGNLATMYENGLGVSQNYGRAAQWLRKAADQGVALAQYNLGVLYGKGQGVPQNYIEAYQWLELAKAGSKAGSGTYNDADHNMRVLAARMTASQIAQAQDKASKWYAIHFRQ